MKTFTVETKTREELVDVTSLVQKAVSESGVDSGIAVCFVPHTTAAVTINENADVRRDIIYKLRKDIPPGEGYHHSEGNSDAHIKASLMGFSEQVLFEDERLVLGTWQAVYFCEFDGPRRRQLIVKVLKGA